MMLQKDMRAMVHSPNGDTLSMESYKESSINNLSWNHRKSKSKKSRSNTRVRRFDSIPRGKMEEILLVYGLPKETVTPIKMLYNNTKGLVRSSDGDTDFNIDTGVL